MAQRGRCTARFERTARFAHENCFPVMTRRSASRAGRTWRRSTSAATVQRRYTGLAYWDFNWREGGGSQRMIKVSERKEFYQQEYCGCLYSLRDTNQHRRSQGRSPIVTVAQFYGRKVDADSKI
jgi:epoxyqueuosine reductase